MIDHYRREAERCRALAAQSPDSEIGARWRSLAADYDKLADAIEQGRDPMPVQRVPMQQQPVQQQQAKIDPQEKK